jgi:RNA polymerase sigma-70 factor (ECF subfamily)
VGDREDRFRRLFDACYSPLHAYARRRTALADADDIVADTLTVAWRRLDDVPTGDGALPWLYGVARRTLANQRRGSGRREALVRRLVRERTAVPAAFGGDAHPILGALERLRPDDREVLQLWAWEQLRADEIAAVLGCSPNAAALRLSRARRRLREAMTASATSRTGEVGKVTDG